jgi:LTXXQ motif family protein
MSYSKSITIPLVAALVVATLGIFVINKTFAHESMRNESHHSWHHDGKRHGENSCSNKSGSFGDYMINRIEKNMDFTTEQEPKWENVKTAFESGQENIKALCSDVKQGGKPEDAPARLALMEKFLESKLDTVKKVQPAVDDLYASLDNKQKETFNELTSRHRHYH